MFKMWIKIKGKGWICSPGPLPGGLTKKSTCWPQSLNDALSNSYLQTHTHIFKNLEACHQTVNTCADNTRTQKQGQRTAMHSSNAAVHLMTADASSFSTQWAKHWTTQTSENVTDSHKCKIFFKGWKNKPCTCRFIHTHGQDCAVRNPASHPQWCRSSLFMAAKFGTLIHRGSLCDLVLQAQVGSELEKASIIRSYKHNYESFKKCTCRMGLIK